VASFQFYAERLRASRIKHPPGDARDMMNCQPGKAYPAVNIQIINTKITSGVIKNVSHSFFLAFKVISRIDYTYQIESAAKLFKNLNNAISLLRKMCIFKVNNS